MPATATLPSSQRLATGRFYLATLARVPRFGVFLPQLRMSFAALLERTLAAEAAGFDSVWLMDHLAAPALPEADCFEGWTLASALAARTSRIRIGHLVLCDAFRHPALLAKMAATLDVISAGRLELGIGWGSVPGELEAFGFGREPAAERAARLAETLDVLRLLFGGERVDYEGRFFRLSGAVARPRPVQDPLPIHVGGAGRKLTLPLAARTASWWNCPSYAAGRLAELAPEAAPARISVQHPVALVQDERERGAVTALAERRFGAWGGLLVGSAAELAERFAAEAALGAELFVLQFHDFGAPETLAAFAAGVGV
jgi:alkanesulfonate monooxygenase SsuD/methylene tetrahydromethanopterin reductase-like flavin-dependent oxidoreductase (luciferase family)